MSRDPTDRGGCDEICTSGMVQAGAVFWRKLLAIRLLFIRRESGLEVVDSGGNERKVGEIFLCLTDWMICCGGLRRS